MRWVKPERWLTTWARLEPAARRRRRLLLAAVGLAGSVMVLGWVRGPPEAAEPLGAVERVGPFEVARTLSVGDPGVVVWVEGRANAPLDGAQPAGLEGATEAAWLERAPRARRVILVDEDPARAERLGRALAGRGRSVAVLEGGLAAWDEAMAEDPAPPVAGGAEAMARHRFEVALRRRFGDASLAPPVEEVAPPPLPAAPAPKSKKREGC